MSKKYPGFSPYKHQKCVQQPDRLLPTKLLYVIVVFRSPDGCHLLVKGPIMVLSHHRGSVLSQQISK